MGLRGILKKLDPKRSDAPSLSNPYAQEQQPTDPPPGYQEHDPRDRDQYIQQPPQKSYGGLPSGPRSGVRPGGAASGYPARSASNGPPPQQYPSPGAQPYQYGGSDYSPNSTGSTPVFPSNTSSPALGSAYPKEKYGAQDGVGGSRWEAPGASSYGNPAPLPSQRQGGYGSLGAQGGGSFAGYTRPSQPTVGPDMSRPEAGFSDGQQQPMTENDQVNGIKDQILETQRARRDVGLRTLAQAEAAADQLDNMNVELVEQSRTLHRAEHNLIDAHGQAQISGVGITELNNARTTIWNLHANSDRNIARQQKKKMDIDSQTRAEHDEATRREAEAMQRLGFGEQQQQQQQVPNSQGLLGAGQRPSRKAALQFEEEEFEDDTGEQRALNEENAEIEERLLGVATRLNKSSLTTKMIVEDQNSQLDRMLLKTDVTNDGVTKQQTRLDIGYLKK